MMHMSDLAAKAGSGKIHKNVSSSGIIPRCLTQYQVREVSSHKHANLLHNSSGFTNTKP